jgi:hypothetical protein
LRFLSILFFFLIVGVGSSCGLFTGSSSDTDEEGNPEFKGVTSLKCSDSQRCKTYCDKWFATKSSLLRECLEQESDDVNKLNAVLASMKKGSWNSIKPEELHILVEFDEDLWPEYAGVNSKTSARDMLKWVAEDEQIANKLNGNMEILKSAFSVLGAPASEDKVVREGMKKDVDLEQHRTFFEVSVFNNNNKAFEEAHNLLKEECNDGKHCIREVYCGIDADPVFGRLEELELGPDAALSGSNLDRSDCN